MSERMILNESIEEKRRKIITSYPVSFYSIGIIFSTFLLLYIAQYFYHPLFLDYSISPSNGITNLQESTPEGMK